MEIPYKSNTVEEGQYRVGSHGMIYVFASQGKVRDEVIHHASDERSVIFGITMILDHHLETPNTSNKWQYHTVA